MKITKRQLRRIIKEEVQRTLHINEGSEDYESKQFAGEKGDWKYVFAPFKKKWALQFADNTVAEGPTSEGGPVPRALVASGGAELEKVIHDWQKANADDIKFGHEPEFKTLTKDGKLFPNLKLDDGDHGDDNYSNTLLDAIDAAEKDFLNQWGY